MPHLADNAAAAQLACTDAALARLNDAVRAVDVGVTRAPEVVMGWNGAEAPDA